MGLVIGLFVICTIFVVLFTKILFKDLSRYFWDETINTLKGFRKGDNNFGDIFTIYAITGLIGLLSFLFLKALLVLSAYLLSEDLIEFFIINRGVFTSAGVELQNPYLLKNILYGLLLTPLAQLSTVYAMVKTIQNFMASVNKRTRKEIFGISDIVYFSAISCLCLIIFDVFVFYQSITIVNTFSNVILLVGAKLAYLLYLFSVLHSVLLKNENYSKSLTEEIDYSIIKRKILSDSKILLPIIFVVGIILQIPLFVGFQFGNNNLFIVLQLILAGTLLYFVLRITCAKGFNYIGVYLIDESRTMQIKSSSTSSFLDRKSFKYSALGILIVLFFVMPKYILFFLFFLILFSILISTSILFLYSIGTFFSRVRFDWNAFRSLLCSIKKASIPMVLSLFIIFILISIAPKKLNSKEYSNYQTTAVDNDGNLIYKSHKDNNPSSLLAFDQIPEFFLRSLIAKEDRGFMGQKGLMINRTNWHGVSITGHSNLNQQLIKNFAFDGKFPQEIQRKLIEYATSYQLSIQSSPKNIITDYINNVSFNGGNNHKGIVNASYYTFGKNISQLNELQMMYLMMTLHRGSDFKIYKKQHLVNREFKTLLENKKEAEQAYENKYNKGFSEKNGRYQVVKTDGQLTFVKYKYAHLSPQTIKNQLIIFAEIWHDDGILSKKELVKLKSQKLDFTNKAYSLNSLASTNSFFSKKMKKNSEDFLSYNTSISYQKQLRTNHGVDAFFDYFNDQRIKSGCELYAAALVVDVKTGDIIAEYGSEGVSELIQFKNGNPIGSVIKPFVLLQLLENGYNIRLYDGKRLGVRAPNNYNHRNSNQYKNAKAILGPSLNTPMGNINEVTDPIKLFVDVENKFAEIGIQSDKFLDLSDLSKKTEHRINYPIGSRNMTLFDIAQAYQTVFNDGKYIELSLFNRAYNPYTLESINFEKNSNRVYSRRNTHHIQNALKSVLQTGGTGYSLNDYLPNNVQFMCKTGTTDEYKHGYTILSDGNTLVVTWVSYGKKENRNLKLGQAQIPNKSGGGSAGILASMIFRELYR